MTADATESSESCDWCGISLGPNAGISEIIVRDRTWILCEADRNDPLRMAALLSGGTPPSSARGPLGD